LRLLDGTIVLSPSDLSKFVRCAHATTLDLGKLLGTLEPLAPPRRSLHTDLVTRKGTEHEANYIERLARAGNRLIPIKSERRTAEDLRNAASDTLDAMRSGADYVYQAVFFDGEWIGAADLLERVDTPSDLGHWSYEVVDTKLARSVKPYFILQLCAYSDQLTRLQGRAPAKMHVILGNQERVTFRVADFNAYYRYIKRRFENRIRNNTDNNTSPYLIDFCALCEWNLHCWRHLERMDHLVRVANIRRDHVRALERAGIRTLTELGATPEAQIDDLRAEMYSTLHHQARLQSEQQRTKQHRYELLAPERERGFDKLPRPSPGDVFLDVEGDPYAGDGLTFLFGIAFDGDYRAFWAHDALQEKRAFEDVMDFIVARRREDPSMHIYHYGALDVATLKRMASEYGTREDEIDDFLRHDVFVDLYTIVRQALRISQPSYGLKKVEAFYFAREEEGVFERGGPILAYEEYLDERDPALLTTIENYNREDCLSTVQLRDWLLELRAEVEHQYGVELPWFTTPAVAPPDREELDALQRAVIPHSELLAHLLQYHRREERPQWWAHFARLEMTPQELIEDSESIGGLELDRKIPPRDEKRSKVYTFHFPAQQHKLAPGDKPVNPETESTAGEIMKLDDATGILELKLSSKQPMPHALIPGEPLPTKPLRQALQRFAMSVVDRGLQATPYSAAADILQRRKLTEGASYLFIQGPPGAGKTWTGAHRIVDLLAEGKRVGVASNSHKAIANLLDEVERITAARGVHFRGLKKQGSDDSVYHWPHITVSDAIDDFTDPGVQLVAGTAWLFADARLDQSIDTVFIDEAGQVALANALVIATAAQNIVLLGDPLQLAQVSQGVHPGGSGASVLEHLLGSEATIPPDRGIFLEHTYRMHPDVCRFVSDVVYDGRLQSAPQCANQRVDSPGMSGTGLRLIALDHEGNSQSSPQEAERIADEIEKLLRGTFTDQQRRTHPLTQRDILVVAPYNAQVRCVNETLRRRGLANVPVGTVDKFQGRQAEVVFFTMTTSSGDDLPRDVDFLFSRNRLNVAISRARSLAVVVANPRLLDVPCNTPEQMMLVNALCRFVEMAERV
jgi:uncharacterized protein